MRQGEKGLALLFVVMMMLLFTGLGFALLSITLSDYRVSRHLADSDKAYYAAEAGVQLAVALLPKAYGEYLVFEDTLVRDGEPPYFTVDVRCDGIRKRIHSVGKANGKTRVLDVVAEICHLGGHVLISGGEVLLADVILEGNILADEIAFCCSKSEVAGDILYHTSVRCVNGGSYLYGGKEAKLGELPEIVIDFEEYEKRVAEEGDWLFAGGGEAPFVFHDFVDEFIYQKIFIAGDLVIHGVFDFEGLVVVRGSVDVNSGDFGGNFVLLAEDDISFTVDGSQGEHIAGGSCFFYSGGSIVDRRSGLKPRFLFHGAMMAAGDVELGEFDLVFDGGAVSEWFWELPEDLFLPFTEFVLTWVDLSPRR
ncbi:MAG: pilus assembly PilX N-terminal domain-containing protein [Clostridiales bacterium]|jgi:hypothetical protein|nr:pilus assembly PilX N-terminal domain-containing protein [Clostridiales bacterium]